MQESLLHRRVDLHCHSVFSDGVFTPTELLAFAKEAEIEVLALTDHDTIHGLSEAHDAAKKQNITLISGVELSIQWSGIPLHMVALDFDRDNLELVKIIEKNQAIRLVRAKKIAELLCKRGLPDLYDKVQEEAGISQIGRPHFASVMLREGIVNKFSKAFDQYLSNKHLGSLKSVWPEMTEVVPRLAGQCDLILAHPKRYSMTLTKLKRLVGDFSDLGGNSIEVASGNENPQNVRALEQICREFKMQASVGSDFHGPISSWSQLGKHTPIQEAHLDTIWHKWLK